MEEKWLPAEHTLTFRVELDPSEAKVLVGGREFGAHEVRLRYRQVAGDGWGKSIVVLTIRRPVTGSRLTFLREELDEIPPWLASIEARASLAANT